MSAVDKRRLVARDDVIVALPGAMPNLPRRLALAHQERLKSGTDALVYFELLSVRVFDEPKHLKLNGSGLDGLIGEDIDDVAFARGNGPIPSPR